jgi:polysaccharide biosynthesis transport protein
MHTGTGSIKRTGIAQTIDELDLGALGRALWQKRRLIIGLTLAAAAIAFAAVNVVTPRYRSEARVLIETRDNILLRQEGERSSERTATVDQEAVTSQVQLILSRGLALEIIRKLRLGEKPEFDPVLRGPSAIRALLGLVGFARDPMSLTPEERVLRSYMERLVAYQVDKSRVIAIEFESQDSDLAAEVVNAISTGFLVLHQAARQEQSRAASEFLAEEIEKLRKGVAEAEAKVEQYRGNTNLLVGANNTTLSSQRLGDYNARLAAARSQQADAEAKARVIREALKRGAPAEFSDINNSELLRRLAEQNVTLRAQLAEQSATLLAQHPRIKELRAQIADLDQQLRSEAERLARSFENDALIARSQADALSASLDQIKKQASTTNAQDVQLRALERDAKAQRDLLESYLAKYREATARDNIGASSPDARIISRGIVSRTPSWPKKLPTVLIAAFGMFSLSAGFILTGQLMGGALPGSASSDVSSEVKWATAPVEAAEPNAMLSAAARIAAAAATARAALAAASPSRSPSGVASADANARMLESAGGGDHRMVVVGARRDVGATRAAIALARTLAKRGRVVLVDLALDRPGLSAIASDTKAPGVRNLVEGVASFGQIITRDRHSRVHLVTCGDAEVRGDAVLSSPRLSIALDALSRCYDYVVLDAGALPEIAPEQFVRFAPRAVLVVDDIEAPATQSARAALLSAGFPTVSVLAGNPDGPEFDTGGKQAAA